MMTKRSVHKLSGITIKLSGHVDAVDWMMISIDDGDDTDDNNECNNLNDNSVIAYN